MNKNSFRLASCFFGNFCLVLFLSKRLLMPATHISEIFLGYLVLFVLINFIFLFFLKKGQSIVLYLTSYFISVVVFIVIVGFSWRFLILSFFVFSLGVVTLFVVDLIYRNIFKYLSDQKYKNFWNWKLFFVLVCYSLCIYFLHNFLIEKNFDRSVEEVKVEYSSSSPKEDLPNDSLLNSVNGKVQSRLSFEVIKSEYLVKVDRGGDVVYVRPSLNYRYMFVFFIFSSIFPLVLVLFLERSHKGARFDNSGTIPGAS